METKTLEMLRAVIKAATMKGSTLDTKGDDAMVIFLMRRMVALEIHDYMRLTHENGKWADTIVRIMEEIIKEQPAAPESEIVRLTKLKFKLAIGEEPYFAGHNDDSGIMLARYLRLQKQLREMVKE